MIDTHCHLYAVEFEADRDVMLEAAKQEGIERIFLPAIDGSTHYMMMQLAKNSEGYCLPMMGLHPCSVDAAFEAELQQVETWLQQEKYYAIGEIGLDFYHSNEWKTQQLEAFVFQIELAKKYALPIVIHSRSSMDECIHAIEQKNETGLKGIFHCFGGDERQAKRIIDMGWMLGIGGVVTYKNAGLAKLMEGLPLENIVLETDAPYLTPVPFRGKRNEPSYIKYVAAKIAEIKNISIEEVISVTTANAKKIFSF
ncbi:MAG: TatD family hydrolase [Chitinophagaceae bacterium]|jgi:TatD DNase family protein